MAEKHPIGIFDSGYGGLTILSEIYRSLPFYDYLYLGDNARAPYGMRSMETVYRFTLQAVEALFARGCNLVVLACNTASAKALRTIQQQNLPTIWEKEGDDRKRVLGIIIPSVEAFDSLSANGHIGILATEGTVSSGSYQIETAKIHPEFKITAEACPMWVSLVEYGEANSDGADYFVKQHIDRLLSRDHAIDTILLGCTHFPLLLEKILKYVPAGIKVISQGDIIAASLKDYLRRHPEIETLCSRGGEISYLTTENGIKFAGSAASFLGRPVEATQISL